MEFNANKTVSYWIDGALYDIDTAETLFQNGKYPYALFFGHLAIEKLLKALFVKQKKQHAPFTHSLPFLASKLTIEIPVEIEEKLAGFMEFYFEGRYPEKQKEYYKRCTKKFAMENLNEIKDVFKWLKEKLHKR
jgi:HEPN domain-containing protein